MTLHDALTLIGIVAGAIVVIDYFRLRRAEYIDARASKAIAALSDRPAEVRCVDVGCGANRSDVCSDGRCRHHCRMYCECKGNNK